MTLALDTKDLLTTFSQLLNVIEPVHGVPLYSRELSACYFPQCYK